MRNLLKAIVSFLLKYFAKIFLARSKIKVIVVSGTTGRFWIKEKIAETLKEKNFFIRSGRKNFNAEIGLPLSVLGLQSGGGDYKKWLSILLRAFAETFFVTQGGEKIDYLILEMAISKPEDMNYLLSIVRPNVVILNGITTVYQENFESLDEIAREYEILIKSLPGDGMAILNSDDERIKKISQSFNGNKIFYGFNSGADIRAGGILKTEFGQSFKLITQNNLAGEEMRVARFGAHHIYAELVSEAVKKSQVR